MKDYWLALGWGWARWYAHIWVIQYIQEHKISVTEVSGTSIGALIAGMYVIEMSANEMRAVFSDINYSMFFDGTMDLWVFGGKKIEKRLKDIFGDKKIEDCKIDCFIVATNLHTGKKKVFKTWLIADAVRASMSLPWIISPYELDGNFYIDGWIVDNLPADLLQNTDVIASSCVETIFDTLESKETIFGISIPDTTITKVRKILHNSIQIMLKNLEDLSIEHSNKKLTLLRPNLEKYHILDIKKLDEIIAVGYKTAKETISN